MGRLDVGDLVVRAHRLLKTQGVVVRIASARRGEARLVWVKWNHPDTLPNPSLEASWDLELVTARADALGASSSVR